MKVRWLVILVFYVLACAISWPLFWLTRYSGMEPVVPPPLLSLGFMWGPGIAALICWAIFRWPKRSWTFWGSWRFTLAFYLAPLLVLSAVLYAVAGPKGLIILPLGGIFGFLMTLGEELGWRGWLQDALRPIPRVWRYVLIGVMWEFWHMRFGSAIFGDMSWAEALLVEAKWLGGAILIAAVIGEAMDRGRAPIVAVTLHLWVNLVMSGEIVGMLGDEVWLPVAVVAGVSVLWWLFLLHGRRFLPPGREGLST